MHKQAEQQLIGTCPACHDRRMVFERIDDTHAECGGCGCEVPIAGPRDAKRPSETI
jgi:hypothetical protein